MTLSARLKLASKSDDQTDPKIKVDGAEIKLKQVHDLANTGH
jgi:hypothetical protein